MKLYWSDKPNSLYTLGTFSLQIHHCVFTLCHWLSQMIRQSVCCSFPLKSNEYLNYVTNHQMAAVNRIGLYVLVGIIMSTAIAGTIASRSHTSTHYFVILPLYCLSESLFCDLDVYCALKGRNENIQRSNTVVNRRASFMQIFPFKVK